MEKKKNTKHFDKSKPKKREDSIDPPEPIDKSRPKFRDVTQDFDEKISKVKYNLARLQLAYWILLSITITVFGIVIIFVPSMVEI